MDSNSKKKRPELRLLKAKEPEASSVPKPKSELAKELTHFADELDKAIENLLLS